MTNTLKKLCLTAVLALPLAAFAGHDDDDDSFRYRGTDAAHVHSHACDHAHDAAVPPPPVARPGERGRYELRPVQQWVAGRYEQVWVPEVCKYKRNGRVKRCTGGYYDRRYVPGGYQTLQQWVWVPAPVYRYEVPPPPPPHRHARFEVRFGT